jgi:hypothetical protein
VKHVKCKRAAVEIEAAKEEAIYTIRSERKGRSHDYTGTLAELIQKFSYTLEKGEHEKGNKKINRNPKNIASLVQNINNAENNAAANGHSGTSYSLVTTEPSKG